MPVAVPVYDVLGLGSVAVDEFLYVAAYPPPDVKVQVRLRDRQCGGLTATALVAAARLGARCAYAGILGPDENSRFVIRAFENAGIDVQHIDLRAEARPIHSTIVVDESKLTRTIFYDLTGTVGAQADAPSAEVLRSARVLFVDHYGIEGMIRAARIVRAAGIPVVADLERNDWPGFAELLALVDHLIVNRAFAAKLTGQAAPELALEKLWSEQRSVVVVTAGEEGCWYRDSTTVAHHAAFPVRAVDTTGCGDVFHGAYAAALARGLELQERIRFASAAAALKAMRLGGQAGIPDLAAVDAFLAERAP